MIRTRRDGSIAAYIQEMGDHIRRQENQLCVNMKKIKKLMKKNNELEEELKSTCEGYEEEIAVLLEKHEDLKRKMGISVENIKRATEIHSEDYIIMDDTDTDSDANYDSNDDYVDEAGANIMESSSIENF